MEQKIQENLICLTHGCHCMSARFPPMERALLAAGMHLNSTSCAASPAGAVADLLHLLDVDDREDADAFLSYTLLHAPSTVSSLPSMTASRIMTCQQRAAVQGASLFLSPSTPLRTRGGVSSLLQGGGLGGGIGGLEGPISVPPPRQARGGE